MILIDLFMALGFLQKVYCILSSSFVNSYNITYLVSIRLVKEDIVNFGMGHLCGGALVGPYLVVTSATCVTEPP